MPTLLCDDEANCALQAMAAMNARKMKFALMKGSFSETGINEFLR